MWLCRLLPPWFSLLFVLSIVLAIVIAAFYCNYTSWSCKNHLEEQSTLINAARALRVAAGNQNQHNMPSWRSASDDGSTENGDPEVSGNTEGVSVIGESNNQQMSCQGQPWECACNSSAVLGMLYLLYFSPGPPPTLITVIAITKII
jgi:glucan phosphoethanolaminetransferase (alkaline phosphatase superfamily)